MGETQNSTLRPAWTPVILAAALAGSGSTLGLRFVAPDILRPDPWTGEAAQEQEDQQREHVRRELLLVKRERLADLRDLESRLERKMPPLPTRERIRALELAVKNLMRERGEDWAPPSDVFAKGARPYFPETGD